MSNTQIINLLNEALKADPDAINALVNYRVIANKNLMDHPTIQCREINGKSYVGLLGVLNAISLIDNEHIVAIFDESDQVLEFQIRSK